MPLIRLPALALVGLWLGCGASMAAERTSKPSAASDDPLRAKGPARFVTLGDIQARIRTTPHKVVLLHLWATWCTPCIQELPTMATLARTLPERGIEVFSVAMDNATRHNAARVSRVIDQKASGALTRAIARVGDADAFIEGIDPQWEGSIPALMAYLPSGQLLGALYGQASHDEVERFVQDLDLIEHAR